MRVAALAQADRLVVAVAVGVLDAGGVGLALPGVAAEPETDTFGHPSTAPCC